MRGIIFSRLPLLPGVNIAEITPSDLQIPATSYKAIEMQGIVGSEGAIEALELVAVEADTTSISRRYDSLNTEIITLKDMTSMNAESKCTGTLRPDRGLGGTAITQAAASGP